MLHKFIHAHHANPDTIDAQGIISLLMSTITGAGDATAATMTAIMFYLLRNPVPLEKLRNELQDAGLSNDEVPSYIQTSKLPYLAAVIKESMRLFPVQTWPLDVLSYSVVSTPPGTSSEWEHLWVSLAQMWKASDQSGGLIQT